MGFSCGCIKTKSIPLLPEEETFKKIKKIGSGGFSEVFLIMSNMTNTEYTAKIITLKNPTEDNLKKAYLEVEILKKCRHPNIILLKDVFKVKNKEGVNLNIITEYCDEGDLEIKVKEKIKNREHFEEIQLINWLMQICLALKYLHKKKIVHRDIKPSNIFLTKKGYVKLGDFGLSRIFQNKLNRQKSIKGTVYFLSPEMVVFQDYNEKADIWALGVTFYYLMNFAYPYYGETERDIMISIALDDKERISKFRKFSYSQEFENLIQSMLSKNPDNRPSAQNILKSKFIKDKMALFLKDNKFNKKEVSKFIEEYENQMKEKKEKKENIDFLEKNVLSNNIENKDLSKEEIDELKKEKDSKEQYEMNKLLKIVKDSI